VQTEGTPANPDSTRLQRQRTMTRGGGARGKVVNAQQETGAEGPLRTKLRTCTTPLRGIAQETRHERESMHKGGACRGTPANQTQDSRTTESAYMTQEGGGGWRAGMPSRQGRRGPQRPMQATSELTTLQRQRTRHEEVGRGGT